jgi:hypothetical protein
VPLFEQYRGQETSDIVSALTGTGVEQEAEEVTPATSDDDGEFDFSEFVPAAGAEEEE